MDTREQLSKLPDEETRKLRRRVEDYLRKTPAALLRVAVPLAEAGEIRYQDLIEPAGLDENKNVTGGNHA
jgi:hypothetical protein